MDFDLSADQKLLVKTAQDFVKRESPISRFRQIRDDPGKATRDVWKAMGELGWLSVMFPEDVGGLGGTFVDAALILAELGTTLCPEPFIPSVVLAGSALARAGTPDQRVTYLTPMMEGSKVLALATAEEGSRYDVTWVESRAERRGDKLLLHGQKRLVPGGHVADAFLISVRTSGSAGERGGVTLAIVDRGAPGLRVDLIRTMDGHHAANLTLSGVEIDASAVIGSVGEATPLLEELVDLGAAAACAEGSGVLRVALDMTVEYLKTREQFGVKIGTFQALQHRAVDMFVETELQKSTAIMAMIKATDPDPLERQRSVSAAKVKLASAGKLVVAQAIQLHGGIGVTDEHDIGLYFKRIHTLSALFGDEEHHLDRFMQLPGFLEGVR